MTKWFDTNYHYLVPEFTADQTFRLASRPSRGRVSGSKNVRVRNTAGSLGPVTYLLLGKTRDEDLIY